MICRIIDFIKASKCQKSRMHFYIIFTVAFTPQKKNIQFLTVKSLSLSYTTQNFYVKGNVTYIGHSIQNVTIS